MVDQLPSAAFEPEDIGRALIELDHRTLLTNAIGRSRCRPNSPCPFPRRRSCPAVRYCRRDRAEPYFEILRKLRSILCVTAGRAQAGDVRAMGPYGAHRSEVAVQGAVERSVEKYGRGADVIFIRRRDAGACDCACAVWASGGARLSNRLQSRPKVYFANTLRIPLVPPPHDNAAVEPAAGSNGAFEQHMEQRGHRSNLM